MSSQDGGPEEADRVAALEARLREARDDDRRDQLRVLLALEHLTADFEKAEGRLRKAERELAERSAVLEQYLLWRREVTQEFRQIADEFRAVNEIVARMDERYAPRDELVRALGPKLERGGGYASSTSRSALPPFAVKALAGAAVLIALALVLALGGGPLLERFAS